MNQIAQTAQIATAPTLDQVLAKLTSSKNERIAFEVIWKQTIGRGKGNCIILPEVFEKAGLVHKNRRNEAILRLIEKGLVFRGLCRAGLCEHKAFRFSVVNSGCVRFLGD